MLGVAEAGQVRSDDVKAVAQQRNQVAEHVAGGREAVQEQELRRAGGDGFAIEDLMPSTSVLR